MPSECAIILVVAAADAILLAETSFRLDASAELRILPVAIFWGVLFLYCRWRRIPSLAHLARTYLALMLFTNAAIILNFILTGILPLPSWDDALATADRALGLDWLEVYQWFTRHPAIEASASEVYFSLGPEMLILLFALELLGHHNQARSLMLWFMVATIATIGIGTLMPAAGAFVHYHLPVASTTGYVAQWADLRNGTLRTINPLDNQGLVVFPSFHATLAVLCIVAAWPVRILKIQLLAYNLLIILSALFVGGHYFIDIFAGIILAALTIIVPRTILSGKKNIRPADAPVFASK